MQQISYRKVGRKQCMVMPYEGEEIGDYCMELFRFHTPSYFMQFEVNEHNECKTIEYHLKYRITLKEAIEKINIADGILCGIIESFIGVMEQADQYLIDRDGIFWKADMIFINVETGEMVFAYNPELQENNGCVRDVLNRILTAVNKNRQSDVMLFLKFYDIITRENVCVDELQQYKKLILRGCEEVDRNENGYKIDMGRSDGYLEGGKSVKTKDDKTKSDKTNHDIQKFIWIVQCILVILLGVNIGLFFCLLIGLLSYQYIKLVLVTMVSFVAMAIVYVYLTKEDTPDEIMEAYVNSDNSIKAESIQAITEMPQEIHYGETTVLREDALSGLEDNEETSLLVKEEDNYQLCLQPVDQNSLKSILIDKSDLVIGCMSENCDYILSGRGISRMHAKIMNRQEGVYLVDLNSTNGTFLNGEELISGKDYLIEAGDMIAFGRTEFNVLKKFLSELSMSLS